jgi:hypothetical protein
MPSDTSPARQKEGVFNRLNGLLRHLVREAAGRNGEPSACVLEPQSVKPSANVPATSQGIDADKKIAGRKRHIGVDTLGLLLAVRITAASVSDNVGGMHLMSRIAATHDHATAAPADTRIQSVSHTRQESNVMFRPDEQPGPSSPFGERRAPASGQTNTARHRDSSCSACSAEKVTDCPTVSSR